MYRDLVLPPSAAAACRPACPWIDLVAVRKIRQIGAPRDMVPASDVEALHGLAGDRGDEVEVLVDVQDELLLTVYLKEGLDFCFFLI